MKNTYQLMAEAMSPADAINKATVFVTVKRTAFYTTYILIGERSAVDSKIQSLFREFNPWGYGTESRYTETGAVVTRANSCG